MKIQEVILRAMDRKITWVQAADIIRVKNRVESRIEQARCGHCS